MDSRPVIAHVLHRLYLAGAEVLAADLARQCKNRYRFVFLCLDEIGPLGDQLSSEGFTVLSMNRQPGIDLRVAKRIRQAVRVHDIQLLHAHQYTPFFYAALSRRFSGQPPILFTEHGRHYPDHRKLKRVVVNRFLLRRRDRVTAVGRFIRQCLVANEGIEEKRVQVIYNGIQAERFTLQDVRWRQKVREELRIGSDQPVILQVARLHPVKDHATGIRAFHLALQAWNERKPSRCPALLLAGDGSEMQAMQSLCTELGCASHVRFLGVRTDIPQLLAASDMFMLSSLSEGISVTLLEAMAAGLPIAATDVGGNSEVIVDQQTGLLSPRQDAQALARNLTALLQNPAQRKQLGLAGRQRVQQIFSQQKMHQAYLQIYDQMLEQID